MKLLGGSGGGGWGGGFNWFAVDQPRHLFALVPQALLSCLVCVEVHYLRNTEIKIKIKQKRGLAEIPTLKIRSKRNPPVNTIKPSPSVHPATLPPLLHTHTHKTLLLSATRDLGLRVVE